MSEGPPVELRDQINKRLTLNWLIQGASQHAGLTLHYLVRAELDALDRKLLPLYDQFALILLVQYWRSEAVALLGRPTRFWKRAATDPAHPFFAHPLLSRYGSMLASSARSRAMERCQAKGVSCAPVLLSLQASYVLWRLPWRERHHRSALEELAKRAAHLVWGISTDRLDAMLTPKVEFGPLRRPRSFTESVLRVGAVGYGGVRCEDDKLIVTARGQNWILLAKELVKGTAELICLHGLNELSDDVYAQVIEAADRLEYEPWMLQTGGELWRRLLAVLPDDRPVARVLMHIARLPPRALESLMIAVIEQPDWARELLAGLGAADA